MAREPQNPGAPKVKRPRGPIVPKPIIVAAKINPNGPDGKPVLQIVKVTRDAADIVDILQADRDVQIAKVMPEKRAKAAVVS